MKKERLTDEQIYRLLEANNLPFQKIEHFARFLKTASEERIFKYFSNYNAYDEQELYFVQNAPADMIVRYFENIKSSDCEFCSEAQIAIIRRGDHNIIMAMFNNRYNFCECPQRDVEIVQRANEQEIDKAIIKGNFSDEGKVELLEYDRVHRTKKIQRFLSCKFDLLPKKAEIALATSGSYEQIRSYLLKRTADLYGFTLEGDFLKIILQRDDIFQQLLKDVPPIKLSKLSMCKYASHRQMMLWLKRNSDLDFLSHQEFCSAMIARGNVDELLLIKRHFFQCKLKASDVQVILDMNNKTLASWLVEKNAEVKLEEPHIFTMLERGWIELVCEGCMFGKLRSSGDLFRALIKFGDDEVFAAVLKSTRFCLNGQIKAAISTVVSSGNPKWIEMCAKKFELRMKHQF